MKVEWVWRKHVVAGAAVLCALLFSSIGAVPFNLKNAFTGKATLGMHLFLLPATKCRKG